MRRNVQRSIRTSKSATRPFYLPQRIGGQQTAAEIVRESRDWLQAVSTCRPNTPKQSSSSRSLFGGGNGAPRTPKSRPVTASTDQFDDDSVCESEAFYDQHQCFGQSTVDLNSINIHETTCNVRHKDETLPQSICKVSNLIRNSNLLGTHLGPPLLGPLKPPLSHRPLSARPISEYLRKSLERMDIDNSNAFNSINKKNRDFRVSGVDDNLQELLRTAFTLAVDIENIPNAKNHHLFKDNASHADLEIGVEDYVGVGEKLFEVMQQIKLGLEVYEFDDQENVSLQTVVCRLIFRLMSHKDDHLRLILAELGLLVRLKGINLARVCKLIYKVAKDPKNDQLFCENKIFCGHVIRLLSDFHFNPDGEHPDAVSSLGDMCSSQLGSTLESLLYLSGALKFLAASPITMDLFCVPEMAIRLTNVHESLEIVSEELDSHLIDDTSKKVQLECEKMSDNVYHVLLQVTEIFCVMSRKPELLLSTGLLQTVVFAISRRVQSATSRTVAFTHSEKTSQRQVFLNWTRLLAYVTEQASVCRFLVGEGEELGQASDCCKCLVKLLFLRRSELDFVVRIAYALGNLAARCEAARSSIFCSRQILKDICSLCQRYIVQLPKTALVAEDSRPVQMTASTASMVLDCQTTVNDVLVKLVRVVANGSIGTESGYRVSMVPECVCLLVDTANISTIENIELLLNSLTGLNNITFFMESGDQTDMLPYQKRIGKVCFRLLDQFNANEEVILGCVRVLGNLTRSPEVRSAMLNVLGKDDELIGRVSFLKLLVDLLESDQSDLVYSTLGLLINLMCESACRLEFRNNVGCEKLIEILRTHAGIDWQLASLACKVMHNLLDDPHLSHFECLGEEVDEELEGLLSDFIDIHIVDSLHQQESRQVDNSEGAIELWKCIWLDDFLPVAKHLLTRLNKD